MQNNIKTQIGVYGKKEHTYFTPYLKLDVGIITPDDSINTFSQSDYGEPKRQCDGGNATDLRLYLASQLK